MKRNNWKFEYTGKDLALASEKKLQHRKKRLEVWTKRKSEIMEEIKAKGLTVDEGNAAVMQAAYSNMGNTMMAAPRVVVDTSLQANLAEAHTKVAHHEQYARDYAGWLAVFNAHPNQTFKLNHDDWLHFFGE